MAAISEKIEALINVQINHELHSAYIYLAMTAQFEAMNLPGMSRWMKLQANEEVEHAMKFFDYLSERGGRVELKPIGAVPREWSSALAIFEAAYEHEVEITKLIHKLMDASKLEKDYATEKVLMWFVEEQVEEEASALAVVENLKKVGDRGPAILMVDHRLGKRKA